MLIGRYEIYDQAKPTITFLPALVSKKAIPSQIDNRKLSLRIFRLNNKAILYNLNSKLRSVSFLKDNKKRGKVAVKLYITKVCLNGNNKPNKNVTKNLKETKI